MSRSLSFWNRLLTSFGLIDDQESGSRSNNRSKGNCNRSRTLRTECLEHRILLAILPLYWNPQGTSTDWNTTAENWSTTPEGNDHVAWGDGTWGDENDKRAVFANNNAKTAIIPENVIVNVRRMDFNVDGCSVTGAGSIVAQTDNANHLFVDVQSGCTATVACAIIESSGDTILEFRGHHVRSSGDTILNY